MRNSLSILRLTHMIGCRLEIGWAPIWISPRMDASCLMPAHPQENCWTSHAVQIRDLIPTMKAKWPTLACPSGDGSRFWEHEWEKHGTCSESILNQHSYFQAALDLRKQVDLLRILGGAGIKPDGGFYSVDGITGAIRDATGFTPGIECNVDESSNGQLYQIYMCVDTNARDLIECPVYPRSKCSSRIEFPPFWDASLIVRRFVLLCSTLIQGTNTVAFINKNKWTFSCLNMVK